MSQNLSVFGFQGMALKERVVLSRERSNKERE
jgi:hypothetical protein